MNISRLLLIGAAVLATAVVGVTTLRPKTEPAAPVATGLPPQQDINQMIAGIEAKLKTNPDDAASWRMLGTAFFEIQRFAESATAYKRAAQLTPASAEAWSSLGEALVMAGKGSVPSDAKTAFTTALARDAKDVRARYFLAVAKDIAGDHKGAINDWIALLKDSPPNAPWQADVRGLITEVGAKQKIDVTARLAAIPGPPAPPSPDAQNAMIASMVDGLAKKLAGNPKDVDGWVMLIRSYTALGRKADANTALKTAIAANPNSAVQLNAAGTPPPPN